MGTFVKEDWASKRRGSVLLLVFECVEENRDGIHELSDGVL
jgi:hypothetical protein